MKQHLKAFLAGMALPATGLPILYTVLYLSGHPAILNMHAEFAPLFLPIIWGLWNMLYFSIREKNPIPETKERLWGMGAILGFLMSIICVFVIGTPQLIFGLQGDWQYIPLFVGPIVYGVFWRYVVNYLNNVVGLKDSNLKFNTMKKTMLDPKSLGLTGGIMWGLGLAILTIVSFYTGYAIEMLNLMATVYPGYEISLIGSLFGLVYGFLDAFIGLWIFAWLYNFFAKN